MRTEELIRAFGSGSYRFEGHTIADEEHNIMAIFDESWGWQFYITGVYNSGSDEAFIDMKALSDMQKLTEVFKRICEDGNAGEPF